MIEINEKLKAFRDDHSRGLFTSIVLLKFYPLAVSINVLEQWALNTE